MKWLRKNMTRVVLEPMGIDVYFTTDRAVMEKAREKIGVEPSTQGPHDGIATEIINDETGGYLILIGVYNGSIGTLAHECAHAVFNAFSRASMNGDYDQKCMQEHFCYQHGRLCSLLEKAWREGVGK